MPRGTVIFVIYLLCLDYCKREFLVREESLRTGIPQSIHTALSMVGTFALKGKEKEV